MKHISTICATRRNPMPIVLQMTFTDGSTSAGVGENYVWWGRLGNFDCWQYFGIIRYQYFIILYCGYCRYSKGFGVRHYGYCLHSGFWTSHTPRARRV